MPDKKPAASDVETYRRRRDRVRKESAGSHHDGSEYPSSDDVLDEIGESDDAGSASAGSAPTSQRERADRSRQ
jgi:hypothetical protein